MGKSGKSRGKKHRRKLGQGGRWRVFAIGVGGVLVVGLAVWIAVAPMRSAQTPPAAVSGAQPVFVTMSGFSPAQLTGRAGQDLTLLFVNNDSRFHTDGGGWHQFRVEALDVDVKIPPSSRQAVTLRSLPAGTYEFYCDVCCGGKENPAMRGVLEVTG